MILHKDYRITRLPTGIRRTLQIILILSIVQQSTCDSRCFLVNGGSSVSFFVSEDSMIGRNIGILDVNGNPNDDISLRLQDNTAPVRIEAKSKNITLTRKLDKEGIEGPSTATFTVICDKLHNNEPSIYIPVTIRVTDVNDNVPRFVGGPFNISISEQTLPGSTILSGIKAVDLDQHGPYSTITFQAVNSKDGKLSDVVRFAEGGLEGRLILLRPLDFESMPTFSVTLRVKDQAAHPLHSDTILYVNVLDADDQNPRFQHVSYSSILPIYPTSGTILDIEPDPILAYDQDTGINSPVKYSISEGRLEAGFFNIDSSSGKISLAKNVLDDQLVQPVTLVLKAEQRDNPDRYAISTFNIGRKGNHNAPLHFVQSEFSVNVPENSPLGTLLFTALTSRPTDKKLKFGVEGDVHGLFKIGSMGQLLLRSKLDYETTQRHIIRLWVTDGFQNASTTGRINVINVNDWAPRFRKSMYEFNVSLEVITGEDAVGQVEVADGDIGDKITLEVKNNDLVYVNENGQLFFKNKSIIKREIMFLVVAKDSGEPPREAFVPVFIRLSNLANENLSANFEIKISVIATVTIVLLATTIGFVVYFGHCRKRRKILSEDIQHRVLDRNISNPLAIQKLPHQNSVRRSNKIHHLMNITSPILSSSYVNENSSPAIGTADCTSPYSNTISNTVSQKAKNVTWSPKVLLKNTPVPPIRSDTTRITKPDVTSLEIDPDTSVTPLETYRRELNSNHTSESRKINGADTLHSNNSLTLYF